MVIACISHVMFMVYFIICNHGNNHHQITVNGAYSQFHIKFLTLLPYKVNIGELGSQGLGVDGVASHPLQVLQLMVFSLN